MTEYTLHFHTRDGEQTLSYAAESMGVALDIVKERAQGDTAHLMADGKVVVVMHLVEQTGVWLVKPVKG